MALLMIPGLSTSFPFRSSPMFDFPVLSTRPKSLWSVFDDLDDFGLATMPQHWFDTRNYFERSATLPAPRIENSESQLKLHFENLPQLDKLQVDVDQGAMKIAGCVVQKSDGMVSKSSFAHSFPIPSGVSQKAEDIVVEASKAGSFTVTFKKTPKAEQAQDTKLVTLETAQAAAEAPQGSSETTETTPESEAVSKASETSTTATTDDPQKESEKPSGKDIKHLLQVQWKQLEPFEDAGMVNGHKVLRMKLPSELSKDSIDLTVDNNDIITVTPVMPSEASSWTTNWTGRSCRLPFTIDADAVTAKFLEGNVLEITVPRRSRKIAISNL